MRIDIVTMPDIQGKSPAEALKVLYEHCRETAILVMKLNNGVEELKRNLGDLEQQLRHR